MDLDDYLTGRPVYIATTEVQRRRHHKKRIDKKWRKRYGVYEVNKMPHGQVISMDGCLWMTKRTFEELKSIMQEGKA